MQNPGLFRTLGYSEPEAYSEPCQLSTMERFRNIVCYNYFCNISFSCLLVHEIDMIFFNVELIFTPEAFIQCKKICGWGRGAGDYEYIDIPPQSLTVILLRNDTHMTSIKIV